MHCKKESKTNYNNELRPAVVTYISIKGMKRTACHVPFKVVTFSYQHSNTLQ